MTAILDDKRIEFFLRHRDDIKAWAALEKDMIRGVKYLLRDLEPVVARELTTRATDATCIRLDYGGWERILIRRPSWPSDLGVVVEWDPRRVDPFGGSLPKIGIFFVPKTQGEKELRRALLERCKQTPGFGEIGFGISKDSVWPVQRVVAKSKDWWADPDAWAQAVGADQLRLWDKVEGLISEVVSSAA